jgi:hypothetical protein
VLQRERGHRDACSLCPVLQREAAHEAQERSALGRTGAARTARAVPARAASTTDGGPRGQGGLRGQRLLSSPCPCPVDCDTRWRLCGTKRRNPRGESALCYRDACSLCPVLHPGLPVAHCPRRTATARMERRNPRGHSNATRTLCSGLPVARRPRRSLIGAPAAVARKDCGSPAQCSH